MNPKVLYLDIETFPLTILAWGVYEQNALSVQEHSLICCFSAKWMGGRHITKALPDYAGYSRRSPNDRKLVLDLWNLFDEADIVVTQNGEKFDIKTIKARFIYHNLKPPSDFKSIDTLKVARSVFRFASNKLDDMGDYLGLGRKIQTGGFDLWKRCMAGEKRAWKTMKRYNAQDVTLLEKVYLRLRPFIKDHPTIGMFTGKMTCPKCGSPKIQAHGFYHSKTAKYQRYKCMSCFGWGRVPVKEKGDKSPIVSI